MTVSRTTSRWEYLGDNVTTAFPYDNLAFAAADMQVWVDGVRLTGGYTVSGIGSATGGAVFFNTPPAVGAAVVLVRETPATQERSYPPNDPFPSSEHERALDKLTVLIQQLESRVSRAILLPPGQSGAPVLFLPPDRAGRLLGFDATGNPVATETTLADFLAAGSSAQVAIDAAAAAAAAAAEAKAYGGNIVRNPLLAPFTATLTGQAVVNLPVDLGPGPGMETAVLVTLDGLVQQAGAYTVSGSTLAFSEPVGSPGMPVRMQALFLGALAVNAAQAMTAAQQATGAVATIGTAVDDVEAIRLQTVLLRNEAQDARDAAQLAAGSIVGSTVPTPAEADAGKVPIVVSGGAAGMLYQLSTLTAAQVGALPITGGTVAGALTVAGNLVVQGETVSVQAQTVEVADNVMVVNKGEIGAGVTAGIAGLQVDRGTAPAYQLVFDEASDTFRVGMSGSLQPVATREDAPVTGRVAVWNGTTYRWETDGTARGWRPLVTESGAARTLALTDAGVYLRCTSAAAVTVTVPPNSAAAIPVGAEVDILQAGAGQVTIAPGSGVTLNSKGGNRKIAGQFSGATLKKVATDAWDLIGDLVA